MRTIGSCAIAIARVLDARGIDSGLILREAGIEHRLQNDPLDRLPHRTVKKLFELSVEATSDPYLGLSVARVMQASNIHALGYSLSSSSTLLAFCQRVVRYYRLLSQAACYSIEEDENEIRLIGQFLVDIVNETQDAFVGFLIQFMRTLYRSDFAPLRVELNRPEPKPGPDPFIDFFRAPVDFGCEKIVLHFNREDMTAALTGANPELALYNDNIVIGYLAELEQDDTVAQVESKLISSLSAGHVTLEMVADQLNISASSLKLKLAEQNTGFQEVLDNARKNLSLSYMYQSDITISEIAYLLGFAKTGSFSRAFRRWTGQSPRQYHAAQRNEHAQY